MGALFRGVFTHPNTVCEQTAEHAPGPAARGDRPEQLSGTANTAREAALERCSRRGLRRLNSAFPLDAARSRSGRSTTPEGHREAGKTGAASRLQLGEPRGSWTGGTRLSKPGRPPPAAAFAA